jgi:hypothetical protein
VEWPLEAKEVDAAGCSLFPELKKNVKMAVLKRCSTLTEHRG